MFLTGKNLPHIKSVLQCRLSYSALRYIKSCTSTTSRCHTPCLCAVHTCSLNENITVQNSLPFVPRCFIGNQKILTLPWFQIRSPEQRNFSTSKIRLCEKSMHETYGSEVDVAQQKKTKRNKKKQRKISKKENLESKEFESKEADTQLTEETNKTFVPKEQKAQQREESSKNLGPKEENKLQTKERKKFVSNKANTLQTREGNKEIVLKKANTQQTEESKKFIPKKANTQHADDRKKFVPRGARQIEEKIELESRGANTQHTDERKKFEPKGANLQQAEDRIEFVSREANTRQTEDRIEFVSREANTQQTEKGKNYVQIIEDIWQREKRKKTGENIPQTEKSKDFIPIVENTSQTEERRTKSSKMSWKLKNDKKVNMVNVKENLQETGGKISEEKNYGDNNTDRYAYHSEYDWGLKDIYQKIIDLDNEGKISLNESAKDRVLTLMGRSHDVNSSYVNYKRAAEMFMREERTPGQRKTFRKNKSKTFRRKYSTLVGEPGTEEFPKDSTSIAEHSTPNLKDEEIEDYFGEGQEVEEVTTWEPPIALTRGTTGVYDVDQLVTLLKEQKAKDVCVIKMPRHLQLSDYMVIATGKSTRQSVAIMATVQYMYKQKKVPNDLYPKFERDQKEWLTVDLGNIILHVMSEESRKYYNLESLWTLGEEFDDNLIDDDEDNVYNLTDSDLEWLKEYDVKNPQNNKKE